MQKIAFYITYLPLRIFGKILPARQALVLMLSLHKRLLTLIADRASEYNGGVSPKHRLMRYHDFFISRVREGEKILDIGSGIGFLAYDLVKVGAEVTGIELSKKNFDKANRLYQDRNLHFINGDALKDLPNQEFDTVVMSNVLEHIEHRPEFIRTAQAKAKATRWLIRVPCFDRDWIVPLAKELGLDSRLDETHFTEFTKESFYQEMAEANLEVKYLEVRWGEIWAELTPKNQWKF